MAQGTHLSHWSQTHSCCQDVLLGCGNSHLLISILFMQGVREIEEWMSHSSGLSLDELRPHMFLLRDRDATGHLLK